MNPQFVLPVVAVAGVIAVVIVFMTIWASRYARCGPNQALIVSGRQVLRPDGTRANYRVVKGGGTFVMPVVETVAVLSLEVFTVEIPRLQARNPAGARVEVDGTAQLKIKGDEASILAAAEHFLSKDVDEIGGIVRPILARHLRAAIGDASTEDLDGDGEACGTRAQAGASGELAGMGLAILGITLRNLRPDRRPA